MAQWGMVSISSSKSTICFIQHGGYSVIDLKEFLEKRHKKADSNKNNDAYYLSISFLLSEGWEPYAATDYDMLFRKTF